jgi:hypothetical protein
MSKHEKQHRTLDFRIAVNIARRKCRAGMLSRVAQKQKISRFFS